ncbi:MAG: hypothetical protein JW953_04485 [Anaerolineae bacterium]|nr:hypothetical protein [Anaerolineae bacterium]
MNTRAITLCHQTRLAVNIVVEDDTGLLAFSIAFATGLFGLFWQVSQWVSVTSYELSASISDVKAALDFTGKVLTIGFNALTYGLGVNL